MRIIGLPKAIEGVQVNTDDSGTAGEKAGRAGGGIAGGVGGALVGKGIGIVWPLFGIGISAAVPLAAVGIVGGWLVVQGVQRRRNRQNKAAEQLPDGDNKPLEKHKHEGNPEWH